MEFSSVISAVRFAVEVQTRIPEFDDDDPPDRRMRFRMGINVGDGIPDGTNMHGDSVNIAARLQSVCPPGDVCVSAVVRDHVQERLGLQFEPMGPLDLKNISRPIEAFRVRLDALPKAALSRRRRLLWAMPIFIVLIGVLAGGYGVWRRELQPTPDVRSSVADNDVPALSLAVLPFTNLSHDPDQEYLAEGISEDLTTDLSHLEGAFVVARESAFTYQGKQVDIREVGHQLGVRYVLEGSVRKLGEAVRINAQLISAIDGAHIWAERFDQQLRDLQAGQDSTVQRIASALNVKFQAATQQPKPQATEAAAYDLVLRARAILREPANESRNAIAAGYFEQALRLDRNSVPAEAGVATMLLRPKDSTKRAEELIARAELVAPTSPDVLAAKFRLQRRLMQYEEAVATFRKLLSVDSSAAGLAAELEYCPHCWGPPENVVDLLERTARLNPQSPDRAMIYFTLGRTLLLLGRDAEAIEWLERGRHVLSEQLPSQSRDADNALVEDIKLDLAAAYALSGQLDDAHAVLASAMTSNKTMDFTVRFFLSRIPPYYDSQRQQQERRIADGLRKAGLRDHLDETADYHIPSLPLLHSTQYGLTPTSVPGATTITTDQMVRLLESKPLVLTTAVGNPTIPGAILFDLPNSGSLTDEWQTALGKLMDLVAKGDKQRPVVTFAYTMNRWPSRNLALRLVALGFTNVYWYRGGLEAWNAHDLPKAPADLQLSPR